MVVCVLRAKIGAKHRAGDPSEARKNYFWVMGGLFGAGR